jgi:GAF domain-containing protein
MPERYFELEQFFDLKACSELMESFKSCTGLPCNIQVHPEPKTVNEFLALGCLLDGPAEDAVRSSGQLKYLPTGTTKALGSDSRSSNFCDALRQSPVADLRCDFSNIYNAERAYFERSARAYRCHATLHDIVAPIRVGDYHVANVFVGQIRDKPFRNVSCLHESFNVEECSGVSGVAFQRAYDKLRTTDRAPPEDIERFLFQLANLITSHATAKAAREVFADIWENLREGCSDQLLLRRFVDAARRLSRFEFASIWMSESGNSDSLRSVYRDWADVPLGQNAHLRKHPKDKGIARLVYAENRPVVLNLPEEIHRIGPYYDVLDQVPEIASAVGIPLRDKGQVVGVMELFSTRPKVFWADTAELLVDYASHVTIAVAGAANLPNLLSQILANDNSKVGLSTLLANVIPSAVGAVACSVFLRESSASDAARCVATTGFCHALGSESESVLCFPRKGVTGWVLHTGREICLPRLNEAQKYCADIDGIADELNTREWILDSGANPISAEQFQELGYMAVPIFGSGRSSPNGVVRAYGFLPFKETELALLRNFAGLLGSPNIDRVRLLRVFAACARLDGEPDSRQLAYKFLTLVTHGQALQINRAILLRYETYFERLRYELAIGPASLHDAREAGHVFGRNPADVPTLDECLLSRVALDIRILQNPIHKLLDGRRFPSLEIGSRIKQLIDSEPLPVITVLRVDEEVTGALLSNLRELDLVTPSVCIMTVNAERSYLLLCDNPMTGRAIDHTTDVMLQLVCGQFVRGCQAIFHDESIRLATATTFQSASAIAAHTVGQTLPRAMIRLESLCERCSDSKLQEELKNVTGIVESALSSLRAFSSYYQPTRPHTNMMVEEVIRSVRDRVLRAFPETLFNVSSGTPLDRCVVVDIDQLLSCFEILAQNSREHANVDRALSIGLNVEFVVPEGGAPKSNLSDGGLCFVFSDNGQGVPPELKTRIFEPAFTSKDGPGGVGLAYVSRIIGLHRGEIDECGEYGRGARFRIVLPVI